MTEIQIKTTNDLPAAAAEFASKLGDSRTIAFYGTMGAGKTTFIRALCQHLGVRDVINSPTFAIVNEYLSGTGEPIYHFDFYRIQKLQEALSIGYYDYTDSGSLCLIEWPELIEDILPEDTLKVNIAENPDGSRTLRF